LSTHNGVRKIIFPFHYNPHLYNPDNQEEVLWKFSFVAYFEVQVVVVS